MNPYNAFIVVVEKSNERVYWGRPKKISDALKEFDKKCKEYTGYGHGMFHLYKDIEIERMVTWAIQLGINPLRAFENYQFLTQKKNIIVKLAHKLSI